MKRSLLLLVLVAAGILAGLSGCAQESAQQEPGSGPMVNDPMETETENAIADEENGIHIFVQSEVRNVTLNGIDVPVEEDTFIPVQGGEAITVNYAYPYGGSMQEATVTLDSYYRYFVIKNNGRYASSLYEETYLADKTSD